MGQSRFVLSFWSAKAREVGELWQGKNVRTCRDLPLNWPRPVFLLFFFFFLGGGVGSARADERTWLRNNDKAHNRTKSKKFLLYKRGEF